MKKKLILKVGTTTLCAGTERISYAKIEDLARQIITLRAQFDVVVVSSGAIAAAHQFVEVNGHDNRIESKQALAAIGQPKLMTIYDEVFASFGLSVAQCLLVYRDFESDSARQNIKNTIGQLIELGYTPIINENDTVSADEIVLGDNDKLSALVAGITDADLLIIASDISGLYDENPNLSQTAELIPEVTDLVAVESFVREIESTQGTGGMTTKLEAAQICQDHQIEMWIVNGGPNNFIIDAIEGRLAFTRFRLT